MDIAILFFLDGHVDFNKTFHYSKMIHQTVLKREEAKVLGSIYKMLSTIKLTIEKFQIK